MKHSYLVPVFHSSKAWHMAQGTTNKRGKKPGKVLPALCNVLGVLLIVAVVGLCLPLVVPSFMGGNVFAVVSPSMEPEIPVGSAVFTESVQPSTLEVGDIVAYNDDGNVITHRVTVNRTGIGELVTKGDANEIEDLNPVPYDNVIGRVTNTVPRFGTFMEIYASPAGKIYLVLTAACGVMLNMVASRMRRSRRAAALADAKAAIKSTSAADITTTGDGVVTKTTTGEVADISTTDGVATISTTLGTSQGSNTDSAEPSANPTQEMPAPAKKSLGKRIRTVAIIVLAVVFVGSGLVIGYVNWQYSLSDALYHDAVDKYQTKGDEPPISIDFAALQAENPDIIGWIYCADTPIDYPVLKGADNDEYLHHDYTHAWNIDGSIFVDADNRDGFVDSNTIIYGHHMNSGSMFASLVKWADQEFYEQHPVVWLLTPQQNYKIVLFSGHNISSTSSMYEIIHEPGEQLTAFLEEAKADSDFDASVRLGDFSLTPNAKYVMLSTCAYVFDGARYVLHGQLVSVGGSGESAQAA